MRKLPPGINTDLDVEKIYNLGSSSFTNVTAHLKELGVTTPHFTRPLKNESYDMLLTLDLTDGTILFVLLDFDSARQTKIFNSDASDWDQPEQLMEKLVHSLRNPEVIILL